jgi:hypothetical protein
MKFNEADAQLETLIVYCEDFIGIDRETLRSSTIEQLMPRSAFEKILRAKFSSSFAGMMVMLGTVIPQVDRRTAETIYGSTGEFLEWCLRRHFENPMVCETAWMTQANGLAREAS